MLIRCGAVWGGERKGEREESRGEGAWAGEAAGAPTTRASLLEGCRPIGASTVKRAPSSAPGAPAPRPSLSRARRARRPSRGGPGEGSGGGPGRRRTVAEQEILFADLHLAAGGASARGGRGLRRGMCAICAETFVRRKRTGLARGGSKEAQKVRGGLVPCGSGTPCLSARRARGSWRMPPGRALG